MNLIERLRPLALPLLVAFAVLYLFGMRSILTTAALLTIAVAVLYLGMSSTLQGLHKAGDGGERCFRHGGRDFRVYVDGAGAVWLRAADVGHLVEQNLSSAVFTKRYPSGFGRVNADIDAWYIRHDALQDFLAKSNQAAHVQRFLAWFQTDFLGMHRFACGTTPAAPNGTPGKPSAQTPYKAGNWFARHWRGETGLMAAIFGGALVVGAACWAVHLLKGPVNITQHYRWFALLHVTQLAVVSGGMYWWGRGVLYSTRRWIAGERSLLAALFACILGFGGVLYGMRAMVDTEKQYFLTDFLTIVLDADDKPRVQFDRGSNRIVLDGSLGFGSSNRVLQVLGNNPQATGIELKSYGGRTVEGFELMRIILENRLQTYVRAECMSACVYAYVGGWLRYVADTARFGLHRSGLAWQKSGKERNSTDEAFASVMRTIGVDEAFIARGLEPSIHEIYEPSVPDVLAAGLATSAWDVAK